MRLRVMEAASEAFPTTRWTLVSHLRQGDDAEVDSALRALCQTYWHPVYAFLRRLGHSAHDAEDLTQGYFAHLIAQGIIGRADEQKGRLRTFLLADLKLYLANERRASNRQKRGGGVPTLSLQAEEAEQALAKQLIDAELTPERAYDRTWVLTLLAHVLRELEADYAREGKQELFAELKSFVVEGTDVDGHARAAEVLGLTVGHVRVQVHRLRSRYRERLLRDVAETVTGSPNEVLSELTHLLGALR